MVNIVALFVLLSLIVGSVNMPGTPRRPRYNVEVAQLAKKINMNSNRTLIRNSVSERTHIHTQYRETSASKYFYSKWIPFAFHIIVGAIDLAWPAIDYKQTASWRERQQSQQGLHHHHPSPRDLVFRCTATLVRDAMSSMSFAQKLASNYCHQLRSSGKGGTAEEDAAADTKCNLMKRQLN